MIIDRHIVQVKLGTRRVRLRVCGGISYEHERAAARMAYQLMRCDGNGPRSHMESSAEPESSKPAQQESRLFPPPLVCRFSSTLVKHEAYKSTCLALRIPT